jgi:uncharacterized membrane protein
MNEAEEIRLLQEELRALRQQVDAQAEKIAALEQRLVVRTTVPPRAPARSFSLENFIGLRLIQFIGIIVLVIGLSIGVKYAIDRNLISTFLRIVLAYLAGLLLYGFSVRLKKNFSLFSALLFSGGMASLYFTTYAAYAYYAMFPFAVSFGIMIALTVYAVYEAIRYDRQEIALLGLVGAYGIPFLISKNSDRPDLLFLYMALINCGVVFLWLRKRWKNVGRIAQNITWLIFLVWAAARLQPQWVSTGWIFLVAFYLLFLGASLAFRAGRQEAWTVSDRSQLVLNNIALYVGSVLLVSDLREIGPPLAPVTLGIAMFTGVEAFAVHRLWKQEAGMVRTFAALALIFFVMFIGLDWDGFTVTLLWLLTAVVVFTWGFVRHSVTARLMAMVLIGATLGKLVVLDSQRFSTVQKVIAYLILGILLLIASFFYQKFRAHIFSDDEEEE